MRKTKIICTMGPSTDKGDVMEQLVREGMDVVLLQPDNKKQKAANSNILMYRFI